MKYVVAISLLLSFGSWASCTHSDSTLKCAKYVRNYDGDTITFSIPNLHPLIGRNISIRLYGVDTPEMRPKYDKSKKSIPASVVCEKHKAKEAKRIVGRVLRYAESIELRNIKRGKYFRIVAEIYYDGKSLADLLIGKKLAYKYYGKKKKKIDWCSTNKNVSFMGRIL